VSSLAYETQEPPKAARQSAAPRACVPHDKKIKGKVTNILPNMAIFVESSPRVSDVYVDAKTWNGRKFKVGDTVHVLVVKHQKGNCQWRAVCFNDDAVVHESLAFIIASNGVSSMPASSACAALYKQCPGSKLIVQTAGGLRNLIDACPKLVRYSLDACGGTVRLVHVDGDGSVARERAKKQDGREEGVSFGEGAARELSRGEVADGFEVVSRSGIASAGRVPASFRHDQSAATPSSTVPRPLPAQEGNLRSSNVFSLLTGIDPAEKKTSKPIKATPATPSAQGAGSGGNVLQAAAASVLSASCGPSSSSTGPSGPHPTSSFDHADAAIRRISGGFGQEGQEDECVICFEGDKSHALIPCGHLVLCEKCSRMVGKGNGAKLQTCPMCNTELVAPYIVKVFKS